MRVNCYAEEMTDRIEVVEKTIDGVKFTGLRFYLYLPVTTKPGNEEVGQLRGPFIHKAGDDDSSSVPFWGKQDLRTQLRAALALLECDYEGC